MLLWGGCQSLYGVKFRLQWYCAECNHMIYWYCACLSASSCLCYEFYAGNTGTQKDTILEIVFFC